MIKNDKILKSYIYKGFIIWKFAEGYTTDAEENGKIFPTLKSVKEFINQELTNGNWLS